MKPPNRIVTWLRSAAVKPGNRRVVHHALVFEGTLLDVLLNGDRITNQDNNNYAWYKNKKTDAQIESLKKAPILTPAVNARWAKVEKQIMQQAPWAPWSNRVFPEFFSKNMSCIHVQLLYGIDLARLCKK